MKAHLSYSPESSDPERIFQLTPGSSGLVRLPAPGEGARGGAITALPRFSAGRRPHAGRGQEATKQAYRHSPAGEISCAAGRAGGSGELRLQRGRTWHGAGTPATRHSECLKQSWTFCVDVYMTAARIAGTRRYTPSCPARRFMRRPARTPAGSCNKDHTEDEEAPGDH